MRAHGHVYKLNKTTQFHCIKIASFNKTIINIIWGDRATFHFFWKITTDATYSIMYYCRQPYHTDYKVRRPDETRIALIRQRQRAEGAHTTTNPALSALQFKKYKISTKRVHNLRNVVRKFHQTARVVVDDALLWRSQIPRVCSFAAYTNVS